MSHILSWARHIGKIRFNETATGGGTKHCTGSFKKNAHIAHTANILLMHANEKPYFRELAL